MPSCCMPRRHVPHFLYSSYAYPSFICNRSAQKDSIFRVSMLATFQSFLYRQSSQSKKITAGFLNPDIASPAGAGMAAARVGARRATRAVDAECAPMSWREMGRARSTTPRIIHRRAVDSGENERLVSNGEATQAFKAAKM